MKVIETGVYQRWYETWVPRPKACSDDTVAVGMSPLRLEEYYSALTACGAGICLACLALLVENCLHRVHLKPGVITAIIE